VCVCVYTYIYTYIYIYIYTYICMHIYGRMGVAGDYGVLAVAVCVYVYVYTVYVSCYLYYIIKMDMMGMVFTKKIGGCVLCLRCLPCSLRPPPASKRIQLYTHTRVLFTRRSRAFVLYDCRFSNHHFLKKTQELITNFSVLS